jgi:transposase
VITPADALPDDAGLLKAMLIAERMESERLRQIIREFQRHRFGRRAESLPEDQLQLALEDTEQEAASSQAASEQKNPPERKARAARRRINRGALPAHLPRIERVVDVTSTVCPCCAGTLHRIGEDVSERLDIVPAQFRVLVVRRPKYACRACTDVVVQAPAPARLIEGGLPTEAMVAQVLVSKFADHLPLYRQAQIHARQGIALDRSTLADWVGRAAFLLRPVHERLLDKLKASPKLFADETTAPVLDPGRGRTKDPGSPGHSHRRRRRPEGPSRGHQCCFSADGRSNLHRPLDPSFDGFCLLEGSQKRGAGAADSLSRSRCYGWPGCPRRLRARPVGRKISGDRAELAPQLAARDAILRLPGSRAKDHLHDERNRGTELKAATCRQDQGTFPGRVPWRGVTEVWPRHLPAGPG